MLPSEYNVENIFEKKKSEQSTNKNTIERFTIQQILS